MLVAIFKFLNNHLNSYSTLLIKIVIKINLEKQKFLNKIEERG